jgi:hypothetical protein
MIEVQHSTDKAGIREFGKWKGLGNGDLLIIDSHEHKPGTLVFLGFVAPPPADLSPGEKTWDGALRFELGESGEAYRRPFGKYVNVRRSKPFIDSTPHDPPTDPEDMDGET